MSVRRALKEIWPLRQTSELDFTDRFMAWWNGAPPRPASKGNSGGVPVSEIEEVLDQPRSDEETETADGTRAEIWTSERRKIVQLLWGDRFNMPGATDYIPELITAMTPSSADTLLNVGVGLGGIQLDAAKRFGAYVTSFNPDRQLCTLADAYAIEHGVDSKVKNEFFSPGSTRFRSGYYTGAILIEYLFRLQDKGELITDIANALKPDTLLVGTDLLFGDHADRAEVENWRSVENGEVFPWTYNDLRAALTRAGFTVRSLDIDTDDYIRRVVGAFVKTLDELRRMKRISGEFDSGLSRALLREAEFWGRRISAMQAGGLQHVKFVGVKPP